MDILWVENHQGFSQIAIKNFLTAHKVTVVPSLAAARVCLTETEYDLVMLDYDLDDGKGTELVQEVVSSPTRPMLIATSSHLTGNQALLDAGAGAICSKMNFAGIEQVIANLSTSQRDIEENS